MYFLYFLLLVTSFVKCENLQTISFNPNDPDDILSELPQELGPDCYDPLHLSSIDFAKTGIRKISPTNLNSTFIKCVNLAENNIDFAPEGIFNSDRLPNLIYLNLSNNQISINNFTSFVNNEKLEILVLDKNEWSWISNAIFDNVLPLRSLERLYLRKNNLPLIKLGFLKSFPKLTHLYLSDNSMGDQIFEPTYAPSGIFDSIPHLHFERNRIAYFTSAYLNKNTKSLYLDGNKLLQFEIKQFYTGQYNLEILSLSGCQLKNSFTTFNITSLKSLDLSHNLFDDQSLTYVRLSSLTGLKNLSLSYNFFTQIPFAIELEKLEFLLLSYNKITAIRPASFIKCKNLKSLSLRGNQISHIEASTFTLLVNLEQLDLAQNKISFMPPLWTDKLSNLHYLNLNFNNFETAEAFSLPRKIKLENLHLRNNTLTALTNKLLLNLPENVTIHVAPIFKTK